MILLVPFSLSSVSSPSSTVLEHLPMVLLNEIEEDDQSTETLLVETNNTSTASSSSSSSHIINRRRLVSPPNSLLPAPKPAHLLTNHHNNNNNNTNCNNNHINNNISRFDHQLQQQQPAHYQPNDALDMNLRGEWIKVLYLKQGVPDNFVPNSFLKDLRKNVNLEKVQLLDIILATGALTQQITSIVILISTFIYLDSFGHSKSTVSLLFTLILLITLFLYLSTIFILPKNNVITEIKSAVIFLVTGIVMSPILRTLTETISTDTIYAMVTLMMLAHLSFYNYGVNAAIVSKPISLNAAFFASVCLASRLSTSYHAFAFLISAIDIFVLFGILYTKLPRFAKTIMTIVFSVISLVMLYHTFSAVYCGLFLFVILFVNFFCPFGYYKMQVYKENIYGPWDEAIIDKSNLIYTTLVDGHGNAQHLTSPVSPTTPTLVPTFYLRPNSATSIGSDLWTKLVKSK